MSSPFRPPTLTAIKDQFKSHILAQEARAESSKDKHGSSRIEKTRIRSHSKSLGDGYNGQRMEKIKERNSSPIRKDLIGEAGYDRASVVIPPLVEVKDEKKRKRREEKVKRRSVSDGQGSTPFELEREGEMEKVDSESRRKKRKEDKNVRNSLGGVKEFDSFDQVMDGVVDGVEVEKSIGKRAKLEQTSQKSHSQMHTMHEHVDLDVVINGNNTVVARGSGKDIVKGAKDVEETDGQKKHNSTGKTNHALQIPTHVINPMGNRDALLQTIMNGCISKTTTTPAVILPGGQIKRSATTEGSNNNNDTQPKKLPQTATRTDKRQGKVSKPRKSKGNTDALKSNGSTSVPSHNSAGTAENLSKTISSIKHSSASKIKALFPQLNDSPAAEADFFDDDEPLMKKRAQRAATASHSPVRTLPASKTGLKACTPDPAVLKKAALEAWEIHPGRIRGTVRGSAGVDDAEVEENLAFSTSYIRGREKGITISGVNFQVHQISSGGEWKFEIEEDVGLRICSVAAGRVDVRLGKTRFGISQGGMWRVKGGERCLVRNKEEETAVVHATSME